MYSKMALPSYRKSLKMFSICLNTSSGIQTGTTLIKYLTWGLMVIVWDFQKWFRNTSVGLMFLSPRTLSCKVLNILLCVLPHGVSHVRGKKIKMDTRVRDKPSKLIGPWRWSEIGWGTNKEYEELVWHALVCLQYLIGGLLCTGPSEDSIGIAAKMHYFILSVGSNDERMDLSGQVSTRKGCSP